MPIKSELESLRDKSGAIRPRQVLAWAKKNKKSLLHKKLIWNNKIAGEKFRLHQIRNLIEIHCVDPYGGREYVSLKIDRVSGGGYRPIQEVLTNEDLRAIMLDGALDDLERLAALYRALPELRPIWSLVSSIRSSARPKPKAV
jgi:hypothetical protein